MYEENAPKAGRTASRGTALFMLGAVIFAAIAGMLVHRLLSGRYRQEPLQSLVVAARDISAGRPFSEGDLRLAEWPRSSVPKGSYAAPSGLLQGEAVPLVPLAAGEPVLRSQLSRPNAGLGVAAKLEPGQRAVSLQVDASLGVAQLLYPGAHVDVLATVRPPGTSSRGDLFTMALLQNVRVLAIGPSIDPVSAHPLRAERQGGIGSAASDAETTKARRVVTLAVALPQAERLVLALRGGEVDVVLRSPKDRATQKTKGTSLGEVFGTPDREDGEAGSEERELDRGGGEPEGDRDLRRRSPRRRPRPSPGPTIRRGNF